MINPHKAHSIIKLRGIFLKLLKQPGVTHMFALTLSLHPLRAPLAPRYFWDRGNGLTQWEHPDCQVTETIAV